MPNHLFNVQGMSCSACAGHVTKALQSVPGVTKASVDLQSHTAVVDFDENLTSFVALADAVRDEGYDLSETNPVEHAG
jgi:copper chaperone CopZ